MTDNSLAGIFAASACVALLALFMLWPRDAETPAEVRVATWPWENAGPASVAPLARQPGAGAAALVTR
ncbi:hypothetical protein [Propylenella binzhouense]|uniref:Uncharacterized protein n=1 Tax=Propylenella binzhouense TaxID=2555902 RepID=A0A964T145_9HYPH|nr:hypothetical protein [Propylenella binzhouense]MYZ46375.1 hypothetical protein [Propylenella binzhouense]